MDIIKYTEEHRIFREAVRRFFAKEVTPFVDEWEEAGIVPRSIWRKMGEQGFLCMDVPEAYGGAGADFLYSVILTEELARTNHTGLAAPLHSDVVVPYITSFGSEELKKKYLPGCVSGEIITAVAMTEPNTGSDLAAIKTTAVEDGSDGLADDVALRDQVRGALRALGERDREVLVTAAWFDLTAAEAARVLGVSRPTYAVRLHRARNRFRAAFGRFAEDNGEAQLMIRDSVTA